MESGDGGADASSLLESANRLVEACTAGLQVTEEQMWLPPLTQLAEALDKLAHEVRDFDTGALEKVETFVEYAAESFGILMEDSATSSLARHPDNPGWLLLCVLHRLLVFDQQGIVNAAVRGRFPSSALQFLCRLREMEVGRTRGAGTTESSEPSEQAGRAQGRRVASDASDGTRAVAVEVARARVFSLLLGLCKHRQVSALVS